jgi:hypothetical protein
VTIEKPSVDNAPVSEGDGGLSYGIIGLIQGAAMFTTMLGAVLLYKFYKKTQADKMEA